jgi:DNA sulfur modification protein DndD
MIFHRLTLKNFGLFCGEQTFSLTPRVRYRKRRPVILIGGKNGAGKTTILEAVRLCLYGARSLGNRVGQSAYHEYLASTIHHSQATSLQPQEASVALEFEHVHSGNKDYYHVKRRWETRRSTKEPVEESLVIHKNSEPLSDFEAEHWQDFLNELIPIGLSQLFFFDGEKIQGLAEDTFGHIFLADSIKSLLGVDLVEQLHSDLKIYLNRSKKDADSDEISQAINSAENELRELETESGCAVEKKTDLDAQADEVGIQITHQEEQIAKEGGNYARRQEELKVQQAVLKEKVVMLENQIREECNELLPFALAASLCEQLRTRLITEAEIEAWNSAHKALKERNRELLEQLEGNEFWESVPELSSQTSVRNTIRQGLTALLAEQLQPPEVLKDFHWVHSFSPSESQRLLNWINSCLSEIPEKFHELNRLFQESNYQLQEVETALGRAPSDEVLKPLMQKLSNLHQQLGGLQKQVKDEEANIQSLMYRRDKVQRRLSQLNESQQEEQANLRRAQLVTGVQSVLEMYSDQLTHVKVEALQEAVVDCFNQLCRKRDLVKRIEIDSQTFAVTLYDRQDRSIPKAELSAGEKQIYAISMLWGLAKTSGRPLPMIIDTPLGRLDSDHRQRLIEHYLPYASHQTIVLSTDTELDKQNFEMLSPHVSHAYHLVYNQIEGSTSAEKRYFWRVKDSEE